MGQFGTETRRWLQSAIKQRKFLLKTERSHKSQLEVEIAIEMLDNYLNSYSYENDVYMARFIRQNSGLIEDILPGSGATGHEKKTRELSQINKRAILIIEHNPPLIPPRGGMKSTHINQKSLQYEMEF